MIEIKISKRLNYFELKILNVFSLVARYINILRIRYQISKLKVVGLNNKFHEKVFISGHENLSLGNNNFIGKSVIFAAYTDISIGNDCAIASGCKFISGNHSYELSPIPINLQDMKYSPILIGDNVWFGYDVIVLPGVKIGSGVVIGAGSVVTNNIPDNSIAAGVPAKIIGNRINKFQLTNV